MSFSGLHLEPGKDLWVVPSDGLGNDPLNHWMSALVLRVIKVPDSNMYGATPI